MNDRTRSIPCKNRFRTGRTLGSILGFLLLLAATAVGQTDRRYVKNPQGERPKPVVAVDNVCAWPNLTVLRDGTIIATIFNQPSHGLMVGDVECWASRDGVSAWTKRGVPAPHDSEDSNRMNVAAGLANNGDLLVISSGWSSLDAAGKPGPPFRARMTHLWVSRSADGGRTWSIDKAGHGLPLDANTPTGQTGKPFGEILPGQDGFLRAALHFYTNKGHALGAGGCHSYAYCSRDDGRTWGDPARIAPATVDDHRRFNETAIFHLGGGKWLAAARWSGLELFRSNDDAKTWRRQQRLTDANQHPGQLTRLSDGRVLLSFGNRVMPKGVNVRFSDDQGRTWSEPFRVVDFEDDGGYPSSVQLPDGRVLTAYYARRIAGHDRYHMGVVVWDPTTTRRR